MEEKLLNELYHAEEKAWDSLARYKFAMFGYWAGVWVHLNRVGGFKKPNPWKELVTIARRPCPAPGHLYCRQPKGGVQ